MRRTLHINDYTPEEHSACFWQDDELSVINERNANIIDYIELKQQQQQGRLQQKPQRHQGQEPHTRGLEQRTSWARGRKVTARQCQYEAVLVVEKLMMTQMRLAKHSSSSILLSSLDDDHYDEHSSLVRSAEELSLQYVEDDEMYFANLLAEACQHISLQSVD
jgi:hypothetical protein